MSARGHFMIRSFQVGTRLRDRYQIIEILSTDTGFGITYKVKDENHPNQPILILKQLKKPTASTLNIQQLPRRQQEEILDKYWQEYLRLFRIETKVLANLGESYPQIPTIYEFFEEHNEYFYVQEYIPGDSLSEEVNESHQLSEAETIKLLIEILEILEFIQNHKNVSGNSSVIHRDIKPDNIIRRSSDQKLVLIDFGLAKQVNVSGIHSNSIAGGTRGYMAPEIVLGEVSFASDIYSVGMIGLFAITGKDPCTTSLLNQTWRTEANVSKEVAAVLNKLISESSKKRYQNASTALGELRKLNSQLGTKTIIQSVNSVKIPVNLIIKSLLGVLVLAAVVITNVVGKQSQNNSQLIADGQAKSGKLTNSSSQALITGKFSNNYRFQSDKRQHLTLEVVSNDFTPLLTLRKLEEPDFKPVRDVSNQNNIFTASLIIEAGEYEIKVTSENVAVGDYTIQAWVANID
jgi:eukaryotic-like serine/threonine-protein kinase